MQKSSAIRAALLSLIFLAALLSPIRGNAESSIAPGGVTKFTLDNGMEVILRENHASPMITSLIFVRAGSKYEDRFNNGVTHLLEHLLFNGTAGRTQEELNRGIERLGGYMNAFTRKGYTAYLVLMPKDFIDYGMATQADMLFNSVFPEDKLAKERGIVIEEIKKDDDAEGAPAEAFFDEKSMAGTPYDQPIIGYEATIANIPREAIIDYYKRFYAPNNIIALIMGDFDSVQMTKTVKSIFGQFPKVDLPPVPVFSGGSIKENRIEEIAASVKSTYIKFSIEAPDYNEPEYFAFNLLEDYLSDNENSPLVSALKSGADPLASSVSAYLDTKTEFCRFNIDITTEKADMIDSITTLTQKVIESLAANLPSEHLLNGYKVSRRCHDIYMSEKLHHYGFTIAPLMAITGWDFFAMLPDRIDSVDTADMESACHRYLDKPSYIATIVYPQTSEELNIYQSPGPKADEVQAFYRDKKFPQYDLSAGKNFKMPQAKATSSAEVRSAKYLKEVLANGLTVVVKSNPDSRVFALNVIARNRSANEPEGKDGITDFVNRMIEKGTTTRTASMLAGELASMGANVTLYDNPFIPFDDKYTTRQFSFMKFETIDQFTEKGIDVFSDMIMNPAFDSVEAEKIRAEIFGLLGRNSGSTYRVARNEFYGALFEGTPYARSIEGSFRTISAITLADLKEHHRRMYSPENMIITVGTGLPGDKVMTMFKNKFGAMPKSGFVSVESGKPAPISGVRTAHEKMEKAQVYIYIGNLLPAANSPDAPALQVANAILSNRLGQNLREKKGWAYSVGSGVALDKNFGWIVCSMGTSAANFENAKNGIIAEIERLKTDSPTKDELEEAVNSLWGSDLMDKLSRINQAFYMGVDEYLGVGYNHDVSLLNEIRKVTAEMVTQTAVKYFDTQNYVIATAGNI